MSETKLKDALRKEHEHALREQVDTYVRLIEVSKRAIDREKLQIQNYEAKLEILRESLAASRGRSDKD